MKAIPNFPRYFASKDGRIWSDKTNKWLRSRPHYKTGQLEVSLYKTGKHYSCSVHRLVLETFVGPCPSGMECCHNNGICTDNKLENLRWATPSENVKDSVKHGTHVDNCGEKHPSHKLTEQDVRMIIEFYKHWYYTQKEIAEMYDITQQTVGDIVNKKTWKHIWRT